MKRKGALLFCVLAWCAAGNAHAAECANPNAIGISRIIAVDPREHTRIGTMSYVETLPLAEKEVVLTLDDGPRPPYTTKILDILAAECVKATFFVIGRNAREYPAVVRRIVEEGHTLGTHTQNHPYRGLRDIAASTGLQEIEDGIASARWALGDQKDKLAPFFRYAGFGNTTESEMYLADKGIMVWGADFPADDWMRIGASEIVRRAMFRLHLKGRGVLLLHDIHPATALGLPALFAALKAGGYKIVHVVPASADHPRTATEPHEWRMVTGPHTPRPWPETPRALKAMTFEDQYAAIAGFTPDTELPFRLITPPQWAARGVDPKAKLEARAIPDWPAIETIRKVALPALVRADPKSFGFEGKFEALAGAPARPAYAEPVKLRKTISVRGHRAKAKRAAHTAMAR
jgi:peptidoglycan/xylan/chitin deacetylase (PgdA/CDA1 family)